MDDTISRQAALDALRDYLIEKRCPDDGTLTCRLIENEVINKLPSAQPYTIYSDGRLWITVDDIDKVTAVVVDEHKSKFCKQFYEDYEEAQPEIIRCKECKWWTKQDDSLQGRCALLQIYPTGGWFCGSAERRKVTT